MLKSSTQVFALCALTALLSACSSSDDDGPANVANNNEDKTITGNPDSAFRLTGGDAGLLETGTPDAYQLTLTEAEGNKITHIVSTDMCAGTDCSITPTAAYHNNSIDWQVQALSGGDVIGDAASGSYATPRSFELTPVTSNEAICSVWPSASYDDVTILNNIWNAGVTEPLLKPTRKLSMATNSVRMCQAVRKRPDYQRLLPACRNSR